MISVGSEKASGIPSASKFDEGEQPEGGAEEVDEPRDLIVSLYKDRVQKKRRALESMKFPRNKPFVAVGMAGFFKRQPLLFTIRCMSAPSQLFLDSGDGFLPTLHKGDFVADLAIL